MDLSIEDYPQLLSNIADILSSDPVLGATLLVSQNIDLDLFVYHLIDNYDRFRCEKQFTYHVTSRGNYSLGVYGNDKYNRNGYQHYAILLDEIQEVIKRKIIKLIDEYT